MSQKTPDRSLGRQLTVLIVGLVALVYLINPTAGIIEAIPDNIPLIGNLDEAGAVVLLLSALRYFGIDFTLLMGGSKKSEEVVEGEYVELDPTDDEA